MFKLTLLVLVIGFAAVLIYASTRPDTFRVERSIVINAPTEAIYPRLIDLREFVKWSPYELKDPAMQRTYSGAETGVSAIYAWKGNKDIGEGSLEIIDATAPTQVVMRLAFIKPFAAVNIAEFNLVPQGRATLLTWSLFGPCPFISKVMGLFFDMDQMIGRDFETGLARLKAQAEA